MAADSSDAAIRLRSVHPWPHMCTMAADVDAKAWADPLPDLSPIDTPGCVLHAVRVADARQLDRPPARDGPRRARRAHPPAARSEETPYRRGGYADEWSGDAGGYAPFEPEPEDALAVREEAASARGAAPRSCRRRHRRAPAPVSTAPVATRSAVAPEAEVP